MGPMAEEATEMVVVAPVMLPKCCRPKYIAHIELPSVYCKPLAVPMMAPKARAISMERR